MLALLFTPKSPSTPFPLISWDHGTLTLSADASDLKYRGERILRVRSARTGQERDFVFAGEEQHDREGDLVSRTFVGPDGLRFKVFND